MPGEELLDPFAEHSTRLVEDDDRFRHGETPRYADLTSSTSPDLIARTRIFHSAGERLTRLSLPHAHLVVVDFDRRAGAAGGTQRKEFGHGRLPPVPGKRFDRRADGLPGGYPSPTVARAPAGGQHHLQIRFEPLKPGHLFVNPPEMVGENLPH